MFLVCFLDLKFAPRPLRAGGEFQIQHTSDDCDIGHAPQRKPSLALSACSAIAGTLAAPIER
jgi:hypothetical protein